jgi:membrane protease YdiL (CAAX protease family)
MVAVASCWLKAIVSSCPINSTPLLHSLAYALGLSSAFVSSLYLLVPQRVREMDRDSEAHIQWRLGASIAVALFAVATFPFMICSCDDLTPSLSALALLGFTSDIKPVIQCLSHTCILYLGASVATLFQARELVERQRRHGKLTSYREIIKALSIDPIFHPFWPQLRNLWAAPAIEELVFRACLVRPLTQSLSTPIHVVWIAPLFFGTAHVHHAFLKWKESGSMRLALMTTIAQFVYTTLFGAYVTYAFLRTNSLPAIIISHQYCNYMGLPDLSFFQPHFGRLSLIYRFRWVVMSTYAIGIVGFVWGFQGILP